LLKKAPRAEIQPGAQAAGSGCASAGGAAQTSTERKRNLKMTQAALPTRDQINRKYKWNDEAVFESREAFEAQIEQMPALLESISAYRGRLAEGPQTLLEAMQALEAVMKPAGMLIVYTNMSYHVNSKDQQAAKDLGRARAVFGKTAAAVAFIDPELLSIGHDTLKQWMEDEPQMRTYEHYINDLFRKQAHVRSAEVEEVLGGLADVFGGPHNTWNMLTDADFQFTPAKSVYGAEIPFSASTIHSILSGQDREARRTAYESFTGTFLAFKNTLASNLTTSIKQYVFETRLRGHSSSLEHSLFENNIPVEVFHNLIDTFRKNLPTWHRYWRIRRKILGVETLHPYDIWAPLTEGQDELPYEQAVDWIVKGMAPLGGEYTSTLRQGCLEDRWVDVYPNEGKTGGAFSSGWVGTPPFIKMAYDDSLFSLSTLAHELGHSMHSHYSRATQPMVYSRYSLFLAEVASNFNQAMVRAYLLENNPDPVFQIGVIEEAMSNFHRYFFIMPTLARFELETHQRVERGQGLSADDLNSLMADLFEEAYGGEMVIDRDQVGITWATFLHMYMDFYVYQYATGIAGAHALAQRILDGEQGAAEAYLSFLKSGSSRYPLEVLKDAGVDLTTPAPVEAAFKIMSGYIDRLEELSGS
jgi:oligoendopeptidase F